MPGAFYIERPDKAERKKEKLAFITLFFAIAVTLYFAITDYASMPDPNASECALGFEKTGCVDGYACKGMLTNCTENDANFKYFFTGWLFDKPHCRAERIYKETCVLKG